MTESSNKKDPTSFENIELGQALRKILATTLSLLGFFTLLLFIIDISFRLSLALPFIVGGILMTLECLLFGLVSILLINSCTRGFSSKLEVLLIAALVPLKFALLAIPLILYRSLGAEAMLPFACGMVVIVPAVLIIGNDKGEKT